MAHGSRLLSVPIQTITTGAITDDPLAPSFGFPGQLGRNLGKLHNWGWELALDSRIIDRPNFAFDLSGSASHIENMIEELGGSLESANFHVGHPYPAVVGAVLLSAEALPDGTGYNPDTAMCDGGGGPNGNLQGGDAVLCNTVAEQQLLYGPSVPPWSFTLAPTLTLFNDLQLFLLAEGQYGAWFADIHRVCAPELQHLPVRLSMRSDVRGRVERGVRRRALQRPRRGQVLEGT
ncbi:MAG: hypothetical protein GEU90_11500 [Gemmatimonas sp.]|nr:hypothetical protein [Gemmatimonas sp.]